MIVFGVSFPKTENLFTYSATDVANIIIIHKGGNENFQKQELKLIYFIKT